MRRAGSDNGILRLRATWPTAARQASLREHNLAVVLDAVVHALNPPSRADIAAASGLTRATVSTLVDVLIQGGLIAELPPAADGRRSGRPATPLVAASGTVVGIGLEVNVTSLSFHAQDLAGNVHRTWRIDESFVDSDAGAVLGLLGSRAAATIAELEAEGRTVVGVGVALPGLVDGPAGPLRRAANLGWTDVDAIGALHAAGLAGYPIQLGNEANLAARAELEKADNRCGFVFVSGEIGIGAGIVLSGEVMTGQHGWAGELGHTTVDPDGPRCACGATGCLEVYAGLRAIAAGCGLSPDASLADVEAVWATGKPEAVAAMRRAGVALGQAVAGLVNVVDVAEVVLGGDFVPLADGIIDPIRAELDRRVVASRWAPIEVRTADSGPNAAAVGAALNALHSLISDPAPWLARTQI